MRICGRLFSARNFCEFREFRGRTCANKLGMGSVEGIRRAAWVWQPQNYLPTEFAEHTETTGGEEKSVYICEIRGSPLRSLTICVHLCASVGGSSTPEASVCSVISVGGLQCWCTSARLVQRRPLHPLGGRRGYGRDAIPSYNKSVGGVATQRGHGGMPCPLMSLFCGCTVYLVGALLALASGKAERRQVHPLISTP